MSDLEIELLNYAEEMLRRGVALQTARTRVEAVDRLTHDIRRVRLRLLEPERLEFQPGQYVDVRIPGTDDHRSFSMANTPAAADELELMVKLYPDGRFSGLLATGQVGPGDELEVTGPYGVFTLRASSPRRLLFIGGGAGMAPILSLLRSLGESGSERPATYYYGARTEADLFALDELHVLPGRFVPALSEQQWAGENGLITDVVDRCEADLDDVDAYLCGPPPMVDAAIALLERRGVPESRIHFDKFTTTAA
jgi:propane monooxygenase reductase subunit